MQNILVQHGIKAESAVKLAATIEDAVRRDVIPAGTQLPTVRRAAIDLKLSPATVASAYRTLQSRGILIAEGRRGTRVSHRPALLRRASLRVPAGVRNLSTGNPDPALLPDLRPILAKIDASPHLYGDQQHCPQLVKAVRTDLAASGIPEGRIAVVNGALDGIERVLREHLRPGDRVAVEDPGFGSIFDLVNSLGLGLVPVRVDDQGPSTAPLREVFESGVHAFIITPRHQNPTGAAVTAPRRAELARLVRRHPDVLVIEDDHASLITDVPYQTLAADARRWALVRSFAKGLNPDLRLAVLTGDNATVGPVEDRFLSNNRWVSHLLQRIVAQCLTDRAVAHKLAHAAREYSARRAALLTALHSRGIEAHGRSGFNVWIPVAEEVATVQALLAEGWAVRAGERFRLAAGPAIRVTTASLAPADAERFAASLAAALSASATSGSA